MTASDDDLIDTTLGGVGHVCPACESHLLLPDPGTARSPWFCTNAAGAPIIKLVNQLIVDAFKMRASDIHLEPLAKHFRVRYRIDGVVHEMKSPPKRLQASIVSRLKIRSNISIAERRIPQDGHIQPQAGSKLIDFRVCCVPTTHGESIVMRILDKKELKRGLGEPGCATVHQQVIACLTRLPDGILLVTGPTSSGKTTTLDAVLNLINRPDRMIIMVEDPVEYGLAGTGLGGRASGLGHPLQETRIPRRARCPT